MKTEHVLCAVFLQIGACFAAEIQVSKTVTRQDRMVGTIDAVQRYFYTHNVVILQNPAPPQRSDGADVTSSEVVEVCRRLSDRGVMVASVVMTPEYLSNFTQRFLTGRRALNVLLSDKQNVHRIISQWSNHPRMVDFVWLLFLNTDESSSLFLEGVNIPFNSNFLVARSSPSGGIRVDILEVYRVSDNSSLREEHFGTWVHGKDRLIGATKTMYVRRRDLEGVVLRGCTIHDPPIVVLNQEANQMSVGGFFGTIWKLLERRLNFSPFWFNNSSTQLVVPEDLSVGKVFGDHTCSGMLGMLICHQADVAIDAFSVTAQRNRTIDYTIPLLFTRYRLFVKKQTGNELHWDDFLKPFSPTLWCTLVATILVLTSALATCHHLGRFYGNEEAEGPSRYHFYDSLLYMFGAFCSQGHDFTPRSMPCRLVYITAYLTSLIMVAAYSAALISSLTVSQVNLPFDNFQGMLKDGSYHFGVINRSEIYYFFVDPMNELHYKVYQKLMLPEPVNFPSTNLEGLQRVCSPHAKFVFMTVYESAMTLLNDVNCSVVMLPYRSFSLSLSFALTVNSPYKGIINHNLRQLRDIGVLYRHRMSNWPVSKEDTLTSSFTQVDFNSIIPILTVLAISVLVSVLMMVAERQEALGRFLFRRLGGPIQPMWRSLQSASSSQDGALKPEQKRRKSTGSGGVSSHGWKD